MKILFFISVMGHGRGGHFHSLNHISQALGTEFDASIFTIGPGKSSVLEANPYFKKHIYFNGKNYFSFKKGLEDEVLKLNPDIIHCFDHNVYNILKLSKVCNRYKFVLTRCGGPNPKSFPRVENLIVFSKENEKWFQGQLKFKSTALFRIPNRIFPVELVNNNKLVRKEENKFCFVRIARIGPSYVKSIENSISLIQALLSGKHHNIHLYIIGHVEDNTIYHELKQKALNLPVTFLTDPQYTLKASDMLYLADAVIATGRGVMEAAALKKPVLVPIINSGIPCLINEQNFGELFNKNFSERCELKLYSPDNNLSSIQSIIADNKRYSESSEYSLRVFNENFNVLTSIPLYKKVYDTAISSKKEISPLTEMILKVKTFLTFYKESLKQY